MNARRAHTSLKPADRVQIALRFCCVILKNRIMNGNLRPFGVFAFSAFVLTPLVLHQHSSFHALEGNRQRAGRPASLGF